MSERAIPPPDIPAADFFERWVPARVAADERRRRGLGETRATLEFTLHGEGGGQFTLRIADGRVVGHAGAAHEAELRVGLEVDTWRRLNSGEISAPEAFLRRKVELTGNLALAVKLHVILG